MIQGVPIEVAGLTKNFGQVRAVDDLSFHVSPGRVTGFLGPNGSGKTTTLRSLLGLVAPTSGATTIGGMPYRALPRPIETVGAALEASGFHPGRTARNHCRIVADAAGLPARRADEVLALVGLSDAAKRKAGGFSLGMRQRLSLATALLGDPGVLILDEPANGLDPEGIAWLRGFLRHLAGEGRTVLVSSHVLAEVQQTVDDVVIINKGRLVHAGPLSSLAEFHPNAVIVRTPQREALRAALDAGIDGVRPTSMDNIDIDGIAVHDLPAALIGRAALHAGVELHELRTENGDLEATFLALTASGQPGGAA